MAPIDIIIRQLVMALIWWLEINEPRAYGMANACTAYCMLALCINGMIIWTRHERDHSGYRPI